MLKKMRDRGSFFFFFWFWSKGDKISWDRFNDRRLIRKSLSS
jgi:hypothetical protein